MTLRLAALLCAAVLAVMASATPARAAELRIGMTQFPSTLNPLIDSMLAKSYVLAMTRRPFTIYDQNWELVCMLCTELPTIENGLAKPEDLADGKRGDLLTLGLARLRRLAPGCRVVGLSATVPMRVPTPKPSIGALEDNKVVITSSSRPPLAKISTLPSPASSSRHPAGV